MFKSIFSHITLQGGLLGAAAFLGWAAMGHWLIALTVGSAYQDALALILWLRRFGDLPLDRHRDA